MGALATIALTGLATRRKSNRLGWFVGVLLASVLVCGSSTGHNPANPLCQLHNRQCSYASARHGMRESRVITGDGRARTSRVGLSRLEAAPTTVRLLRRFLAENCQILSGLLLRQTCLSPGDGQLLPVFLGGGPDFREKTAFTVAVEDELRVRAGRTA